MAVCCVRATATVSVARCGDRDVVVDQRAAAPYAIRQCAGRILLASSAAAPVGGDALELVVDLGPGARAHIGSVAASMVWPGPDGRWSSTTTMCSVGAGGHLDLRPEPTISVSGSRHRTSTTIRLHRGATCRAIEEVVLGRTGEDSGRLDLVVALERDGHVVLRHEEQFGPDVTGALSSVSVGRARHVLSAVLVGVDAGPSRVAVESQRATAWLPLARDVVVVMAVGADRPSVLDGVASLAPEVLR